MAAGEGAAAGRGRRRRGGVRSGIASVLDARGEVEEEEREHRLVLLQCAGARVWVTARAPDRAGVSVAPDEVRVPGRRLGDVNVEVNALAALLRGRRADRGVDREDVRSGVRRRPELRLRVDRIDVVPDAVSGDRRVRERSLRPARRCGVAREDGAQPLREREPLGEGLIEGKRVVPRESTAGRSSRSRWRSGCSRSRHPGSSRCAVAVPGVLEVCREDPASRVQVVR